VTPRVLPRKHQQLPVRSEPSLCVATPRVSIGPAGSCIKDCEARARYPHACWAQNGTIIFSLSSFVRLLLFQLQTVSAPTPRKRGH